MSIRPRVSDTLGELLQAQGDYKGARPLFERALAIREKMCGPVHTATAQTLTNLASLLEKQGEFERARPLLERAHAISEEALGPEHANTATSLSNLAHLLQAQGDLAGARLLYKRSHRISEKSLGAEHRDMDASRVTALELEGDLAGARLLAECVLAARENALGPEHPDVAVGLTDLASLLMDQGIFRSARSRFRRRFSAPSIRIRHRSSTILRCCSKIRATCRGRGH
jgi:tetratricopeptide (TPR) repeat protein